MIHKPSVSGDPSAAASANASMGMVYSSRSLVGPRWPQALLNDVQTADIHGIAVNGYHDVPPMPKTKQKQVREAHNLFLHAC